MSGFFFGSFFMQSSMSVETRAAARHARAQIRKVAVCGAGVMGAQIAAHCVNAGIPVVLFDLATKEGDRSAVADRGAEHQPRLPAAA